MSGSGPCCEGAEGGLDNVPFEVLWWGLLAYSPSLSSVQAATTSHTLGKQTLVHTGIMVVHQVWQSHFPSHHWFRKGHGPSGHS